MEPRVPLELVFEILAFVPGSSGSTVDDYATLRACCLASRAWTTKAQAALFRDVHHSTAALAWRDLFLRSITENPTLGTYVRALDLRIVRKSIGYGPARQITEAHFVTILRRCPGVERLTLHVWQNALQPQTVAQLAALNLRITTLEWDCNSEVLYQALSLWPSIRSLRLCKALSDTLPPQRPPLALREVSTNALYQPEGSAVLQWLLPPAEAGTGPPLRVLDLGEHPDDVWDVLEAHAPGLRSLTVHRPLLAPLEFPSLRELVVRQEPTTPFIVPRSVRCLGFHPLWKDDGRGELCHIAEAIRESPQLRVFSMNLHVSEANVVVLKAVCEQRGVNLIVHGRLYNFPNPMYWL